MRAFWLLCALLLLLALFASGCAGPSSLALEGEHVSHPTVGAPFTDRYDEDALTQVSAIARWRSESGFYADAGLGYKVRDGGFYGPRITGTVRVGHEWVLRK